MQPNCEYILCFGTDQILLDTRRMLLEHAGYATFATADLDVALACLAEGKVNIVVLCHTLSYQDLGEVIRVHEERCLDASILYLSAGDRKLSLVCGEVFNARQGPLAFLRKVANLNAVSLWRSGNPALYSNLQAQKCSYQT